MSSVTLFQASPSLKKAAGLINSVNGEKFTKVLARVLQRLHIKDEPVFSDEECAKLQIALELESQELELVLETTSFILQQAAYHLAKPPLLLKQLQEIGLAEDKASLFGQVWGTQGKVVVEKLRSRQFYPTQLQDVKWRLNLQMAQSSCTRLKQPNALFEFKVTSGEEEERIRIDFTHSELFNFYEKLEAIQEQLDSLS